MIDDNELGDGAASAGHPARNPDAAELPAGRELDALVAEQVMGWTWDETRCRVCGWRLGRWPAEGCVPDNCSMRPAPERRADDPAHYSTDIAAAWQVVEKMRERGWAVVIRDDHSRHSGPFWDVEMWRNDDVASSDATNAPEAICRAALRAVGVSSAEHEPTAPRPELSHTSNPLAPQ